MSHTHGQDCLGMVDPAIYDGVLYWICSDGEMRTAWRSGPRHDAAISAIGATSAALNHLAKPQENA